jgi:hypothetical protein
MEQKKAALGRGTERKKLLVGKEQEGEVLGDSKGRAKTECIAQNTVQKLDLDSI